MDGDRRRLPHHGNEPRGSRLSARRRGHRHQLRGHHRTLPDRGSRHHRGPRRHGTVHADRRPCLRRRLLEDPPRHPAVRAGRRQPGGRPRDQRGGASARGHEAGRSAPAAGRVSAALPERARDTARRGAHPSGAPGLGPCRRAPGPHRRVAARYRRPGASGDGGARRDAEPRKRAGLMAVRAGEERRLRAGVVGAGHMGQYHMLAYAELWDVDLVGVVDVDRDRAKQVAAYYDTQALSDHHELIGKVDLASVAVPTEQHFQVASDLMEAGIGVLVEKPITPTLEEARDLFAIARRTGTVLHVGHVERFNGAVQELKKIVERPILVESRRLGPFVPRVQKDTVVMDLMIHDLDIVLGLVASPPRRLAASGAAVVSDAIDVANVQIWFDSGTIATITASRATEEKIRTLAITQPDAYVVLDYLVQDIQIHRRAAQESTPNRESIRYRQASFVEHLFVHKENPLKLEVLNLVRAARRQAAGEPGELAEAEDIRSLAMALEIERLIRDRRPEIELAPDWPWSAGSA